LLAHAVLKQVWAVAARFVVARRRRTPGYPWCRQGAGILVASDSRNAGRLVGLLRRTINKLGVIILAPKIKSCIKKGGFLTVLK
jgi:hypothetical protein